MGSGSFDGKFGLINRKEREARTPWGERIPINIFVSIGSSLELLLTNLVPVVIRV